MKNPESRANLWFDWVSSQAKQCISNSRSNRRIDAPPAAGPPDGRAEAKQNPYSTKERINAKASSSAYAGGKYIA
jgi:hypothetical protein